MLTYPPGRAHEKRYVHDPAPAARRRHRPRPQRGGAGGDLLPRPGRHRQRHRRLALAGRINWTSVRNSGIEFAFIKATEGTSYKDPRFNTNYVAAYNAGVIRGAYHFARPAASSGAVQANYLASNGGAWSADSRTLPAALDIENNPSGAQCYGLSTTQMRNWIADFLNTYRARTGRYAVIYTTANFWNTCTGKLHRLRRQPSDVGGALGEHRAAPCRPAGVSGASGSTPRPAGSPASAATWTATTGTAPAPA